MPDEMAAKPVIYCLRDPNTKAIRYVGKANDLRARIRCHLWEARSSDLQTRKVRWLRTLAGPPIVEVLETVTPDTWPERERFWIRTLRDEGVDLTNFTDGGEIGFEGQRHTEDSKAKSRAAAIARGSRPPTRAGVPVSAETRRKMSETRKKMAELGIRRGAQPPATGGWNKGQRSTHCKAGHERNTENAYYSNGRYRYCKKCQAQHGKNWRAKNAA